jgi:molecular chaperone DnaK (HSP70)
MTAKPLPADTNEARPVRYIIGIDLGTTNSALAYVDTTDPARTIRDFPIRQYTDTATEEQRDTLPSFLYALLPEERTAADEAVDPVYRVGWHAREQGALAPGRLIASTKSWLCHGGVDRQSAVLPWHAAEDAERRSPVQAQAAILRHLRYAWDQAHPVDPLAEQEVYITVPASFDEVARELTVAAARLAGIPALILLEEPQAAFYAWLARHEEDWSASLQADDHVLICDIGGGTTDLTLIHTRAGTDGIPVFHRTAVGEHLILGGDNLDLALAHHLEDRFGPEPLDPRSWSTLVRRCRQYKEALLADAAPEQIEVVLPGRGARVLGGHRQTTLTRTEVETLLVDGFLPQVEWTALPARRSSGFQEFGLPYTADAAITRYLAEFLRTHLPRLPDGTAQPPKAVLLNGGLFESAVMRRRIHEVLRDWFDDAAPRELDHQRLDLAVARGAAYFGLARRGLAVRVISDLARAYYIGIDRSQSSDRREALCVAPAGLTAEVPLQIDQHPLRVRLKRPVEFQLYVSSTRTIDRPGDSVTLDPELFTPLPPLRTVLAVGKQASQDEIDVHLHAVLNELGTLDLRIVEAAGTRTWKLAFDLRAATRTDMAFHTGTGEQGGLLDSATLAHTEDALRRHFDTPAARIQGTSALKELEQVLGLPRGQWPATMLRAWWSALVELEPVRHRSAPHEQRWLHLLGYCLRPGFGIALDDWRVAETWKWSHAGPVHYTHDMVRAEWWIVWRRLAGGLTSGQQTALAGPLLAAMKSLFGGKPKVRILNRDVRLADHETVELLRLLALLERLPQERRRAFGDAWLARLTAGGLNRTHQQAAYWGLARLGAREPLYGPVNCVVAAESAGHWIETLGQLQDPPREAAATLMTLARRTGDRYRDVPPAIREFVLERLKAWQAPAHYSELVRTGGTLDANEEAQAFGDQLPSGLLWAG